MTKLKECGVLTNPGSLTRVTSVFGGDKAETQAWLMMIRYRQRWAITNDEFREMIGEVRQMRKAGRY